MLAKVPGLQGRSRAPRRSRSRTRTRHRGRLAKTLGVAHVLEGSVRKSGDRVRITAQLIDARRTARTCGRRPTTASSRTSSRSRTRSRGDRRGARGACSATRRHAGRAANGESGGLRAIPSRSVPVEPAEGRCSLPASVDHFQRAVELDPQFAVAWAGPADVKLTLPWYVVGTPTGIGLRKADARRPSRRSRLEPGLAEARRRWGCTRRPSSLDVARRPRRNSARLSSSIRGSDGITWYSIPLSRSGSA